MFMHSLHRDRTVDRFAVVDAGDDDDFAMHCCGFREHIQVCSGFVIAGV